MSDFHDIAKVFVGANSVHEHEATRFTIFFVRDVDYKGMIICIADY